MASPELNPLRPVPSGGSEKLGPLAWDYSYLKGIFKERRRLCTICPTPCVPLPQVTNLNLKCPLPVSRWAPLDQTLPGLDDLQERMARPGLGDYVEKLVKPIARALRLKCLDDQGNLKPDSGCAQRRMWLNRKFPHA